MLRPQTEESLFLNGVGRRRHIFITKTGFHLPLPEPDGQLSLHPALQLAGHSLWGISAVVPHVRGGRDTAYRVRVVVLRALPAPGFSHVSPSIHRRDGTRGSSWSHRPGSGIQL